MLTSLLTIIVSVAISLGSFFSISQPAPQVPSTESIQKYIDLSIQAKIKDSKLGAAPDYFAGTTFNLAGSGISSSATSITLSSLTVTQSGQPIRTADLIAGVGNKFYITIEPGNRTRQEVSSCTTVTQNSNGTATLTGCSRGLAPITPYTASTTLSFVHAGGSQVIFSNPPQVYRDLVTYIDSASIAGAVDSGATAKGVIEKSTAAEAAAHAAVGSGNTTAPLALTSDIASSTRTANTPQVVIASSTDGYIDISYIATTTLGSQFGKNRQVFTSSGTFAPPTGVLKVLVQVVGAGGGGGGGENASPPHVNGGGGGGGYCWTVADVSATTSVKVTIGTGGAGGIPPGGGAAAPGSSGGDSYFSTFCKATGGSGGGGTAATANLVGIGGAGGVGSLGDLGISGNPGGTGTITAASASTISGNGGGSVLGGGGLAVNSSTNGNTGGNYGGGGSGSVTNGGNTNGGAGANGLVIITW